MLPQHPVSPRTLQRLPLYVSYLHSLPKDALYVSSTEIATQLGLHPVQVRKDLAAVGAKGRPRNGFQVQSLVRHLVDYLNGGTQHSAVLVGMGHLGKALAAHFGVSHYGFPIQAVFDNDQRLVGRRLAGYEVQDLQNLVPLCRKLRPAVGIITVPAEEAQGVCDLLVQAGVRVIWNFAPTHLTVPKDVTVQDEDIAASLALITKQILGQQPSLVPISCKEENVRDGIL